MDESGFDYEERLKLYKVLIGILQLRKVTFKLEASDSDEKYQVSKSSEHILHNLMKLFQLDVGTLENALVSRSIKDKDSMIKFVFVFYFLFTSSVYEMNFVLFLLE